MSAGREPFDRSECDSSAQVMRTSTVPGLVNSREGIPRQLRILLLEDDQSDAELILRAVRNGGITHVSRCVSARDEFLAALTEFGPDLVLSDHKLPGFNGTDALTIVREQNPDLPFILVTGALGEELAVETIKQGATDYILKNRLSHLVPAILRAVRETEQRSQRRQAEELVKHQHHKLELQNEALKKAARDLEASRRRYARLYDTAPVGYATLSEEGIIHELNSRAAQMLGRERAQLIETAFTSYVIPADVHKFADHMWKCRKSPGAVRTELALTVPDRDSITVEMFSVSAQEPEEQTTFYQTAITDITERMRSEQTLRESEERFRQLTENIHEVFWMTDPEKSQMLYISPGYEAIWGRTCQSLYASPRNWVEAIHSDDRERVMEAALTKQAAGQYDEVYRIVRPDRSVRWIQDRAFPVRHDSGEVYRIVGIAEDITNHKRAEEALRESEARKNSIMQSALDAIITIDHQGMIVEFNAAAEKTFGCNRAVVIGKEMALVIIPPSLRGWFQGGLTRSFAGDEGPIRGSRIEMAALRADGMEFPVECTITQIELDGLPMFTAFLRDITGRKRAEEQIRLLADAVQSTHEMISITDHENRFRFVNHAFLHAYDYTEAEVLGRTPHFLYSPANASGLCEQVFQETLGGGWRGEIVNCRKDGTELPISLSTSQIKDSHGRILGLVGVARDISDRKRNEKQSAAFALLGYRLSAATTAEQAANIILEIASVLFGWDAGYVHLYSQAEDKIIPVLTVDTLDGKRTPILPVSFTLDPSPLMRGVMKKGSRLINRTGKRLPAVKLVPFGDSQRPSASMMYVPIHSSRSVLGILSIQSYTPHAYSQRDLHLLQILADHCGDALRRIEISEALRGAEAQYRSIFEHATEGIFQTTPEGRYRSANPALAHMFGYRTPEELMSSVTDIGRQTYVVPEKWEELKRLLETQASVQGFEAERYRKDGKKIWMRLNGHVVRGASGAVLYYEGTNRDITGRKLAEAARHESEALKSAILEAALDCIIVMDHAGRIIEFNPAAEKTFGYSRSEVLGQPLDEKIVPPALREHHHQGMIHYLATGKGPVLGKRLEMTAMRADGSELPVELAIIPIQLGEQSVFTVYLRDISVRKQAEEESRRLPQRLIEAQETERLRVARELHDGVNQLLASAKMRLRKVEERVSALSPAAKEILARCNLLLVQALEENRRIAHNLRPSDLDELGLAAACRNLCKGFRSRTTLVVKFSSPRNWQRQSPALELNLFRVAQEALNNAEKHARAKNIRLRLAIRDGTIVLEIHDDGRGFDPNLSGTTRRKRRGIGLTNMRERAAALGGTCEVQSVPGQGTTITVTVPRPDAQ